MGSIIIWNKRAPRFDNFFSGPYNILSALQLKRLTRRTAWGFAEQLNMLGERPTVMQEAEHRLHKKTWEKNLKMNNLFRINDH